MRSYLMDDNMSVFLSLITNKFVILVTVVGIALSTFAYQRYTINNLSNSIDNLNVELTSAKNVIETQKTTIDKIIKDYKNIISSKESLTNEVRELKTKNESLKNTLYREQRGKKKLEELAIKKSKLIEKAVNSGTEKVFKCFEDISKGNKCK